MEDPDQKVKEISDGIENLSASGGIKENNSGTKRGTRVSKAQKRRDKKAAKESEREQRIAEQERENLLGARHIENETIKNILKKRGLAIYEIPSNGDCLYAAISHQLVSLETPMSVSKLRQLTATYMRENPHLFLPFLCDQDTGDLLDSETYEKYCKDTEELSIWGGQPELQAMAHVLQMRIEVVQAEGPPIIIGEEYQEHPPLILIYHRHMYGLGEHYNSVVTDAQTAADDEFTQL